MNPFTYLRRLAFTYSPNNDSIFFLFDGTFCKFSSLYYYMVKSPQAWAVKNQQFFFCSRFFFNVPINETQLELPETFISLGTAPPLPNAVC